MKLYVIILLVVLLVFMSIYNSCSDGCKITFAPTTLDDSSGWQFGNGISQPTLNSCSRQSSPPEQFSGQGDMRDIVNNSPYFRNMNAPDLHARSAISSEDYKAKYTKAIQSFTTEQQNELAEITRYINRITNTTKVYRDIPWKFAKVSTNIENGYPHTLYDVIILSDDFFIYPQNRKVSTLIHEKVHVLQRMHPHLATSFTETMGFKALKETTKNINGIKRNNPDLDGVYVYKDHLIPVQVYHNDKPRDISESSTYIYNMKDNTFKTLENVPEYDIPAYISQKEHPFEIMGVIIPMIIMKQEKNDRFYKIAATWVAHNL